MNNRMVGECYHETAADGSSNDPEDDGFKCTMDQHGARRFSSLPIRVFINLFYFLHNYVHCFKWVLPSLIHREILDYMLEETNIDY